ncbi:FecR family protein [Flavivirga sp. 57AJ16]|uniref:FecR family protein n=1 Tax=Flavivirga sp. 57AJ16 TaxID=3025307 RepID=UPI0023672671|nr:FecR family protein [Flavivirga sp. 57AJ16]MDD7885452.1 FecR domain-containing protein [Flavivirga sp. 57AJ16]
MRKINLKIENIIHKYLLNEASSEDLDLLSNWIIKEDNEAIFENQVKTHLEITMAMNEPNTDKIKKELFKRIKRDKNKRVVNLMMKYAAVLVLLLSFGYFYDQHDQIDYHTTESNKLVPKVEQITITLDDGTVEELSPAENKEIRKADGTLIGSQDHSKLTYSKTAKAEELVYNTLNVPYGKRFDVVLSDGTHIYLNSGTTLRYPVNFVKKENRTVFLKGEAYFDVAKDAGRPFVVNTNGVDVKVLGTKFNVSNYAEDTSINTVLVEGSVELYKNSEQYGKDRNPLLLKPGFKARWDRSNNEIGTENVDTRLYTAWIEGKLIFRNTSFLKIRRTLERKYNVTIKNSNSVLDEQLFDATFDIETIGEVLESFNKSFAIDYSIINNEVIIE